MAKRPPPKPPTISPHIAQDIFDGALPGIDWIGDATPYQRRFPYARQDAPLAKARPRLRLIRGGKC